MAVSRVVSEIFNVEKCRDLEIGGQRSLKVIESCTMRKSNENRQFSHRSVTDTQPPSQPPSQPATQPRCRSYYAQRSGVEPKNHAKIWYYFTRSRRKNRMCSQCSLSLGKTDFRHMDFWQI